MGFDRMPEEGAALYKHPLSCGAKIFVCAHSGCSMTSVLSEDMLREVHRLAVAVESNQVNSAHAVTQLVSLGLTQGRARGHISCWRHLCSGTVFKVNVGAPALRFFLSRIAGLGPHELLTALGAVNLYIRHYESPLSKQRKAESIREVMREFAALLARSAVSSTQKEDLAVEVKTSLRDSPEARSTRLSSAQDTPAAIVRLVIDYKRNPDVIAEALYRADGVCQKCKAQAPFKRAKDSSPYLEVHHVIQLAHGGPDNVENVIALCPNCHRESHFGTQKN